MSDDVVANDESLVVNAASPVPPVFAFGVAMTVGVFLIFVAPGLIHTRFGEVVRHGALALVVLAAIPKRVHVGPEAIRIRWLLHSRLVRYADVTRAAPLRDDVVIVLKNGAAIRLHPPIFGRTRRTRVALERIWKTLAAGAEAGSRGAERALLSRANRTPRGWIVALRELAPHGGQYRSGIDRDRLWAIVENPGVEIELRAAGAIALSAGFDGIARERLRTAARASVDPKLREALEGIAAAEDVPELERALAPVTTSHP